MMVCVLVSIVYMSRAAVPFDDDDLAELLREARLRNEALGVSGLLVAKGGRFMQLLEGRRGAWTTGSGRSRTTPGTAR